MAPCAQPSSPRQYEAISQLVDKVVGSFEAMELLPMNEIENTDKLAVIKSNPKPHRRAYQNNDRQVNSDFITTGTNKASSIQQAKSASKSASRSSSGQSWIDVSDSYASTDIDSSRKGHQLHEEITGTPESQGAGVDLDQVVFKRQTSLAPARQEVGELAKLIQAEKARQSRSIWPLEESIISDSDDEFATAHIPPPKRCTARVPRRNAHAGLVRSRFQPEKSCGLPYDGKETDFYWFVWDNCSHF
ncbi:hypothetical protein F4779DRAFT_635607 [Xylariaceae sp. FL0662B]|nr:hypothetical protein F4779DRAFT_635607 [Xylariaceae sp. FL0662B]